MCNMLILHIFCGNLQEEFYIYFAVFCIEKCEICYMWYAKYVICDIWYVTCDMWYDMWSVICDL